MAKSWSGVAEKLKGTASHTGRALTGAASGTMSAGAGVGGFLNKTALYVSDAAASIMHGIAKLANTKLGKAAIAISATVAAALGVKSWHDKREARKHAESVVTQSEEGVSLQEQLAAKRQALAKLSADMGERNQVSGNAVQNVLNGRSTGQAFNTSQPNP